MFGIGAGHFGRHIPDEARARMLSILFYILFLAFTLVYFVVFSVVFALTVAFDRRRSVVHWLSRVWTKCYFGIIPSWRVKTSGLENIDRTKSYVVIVNHRSMLDILLMYAVPLNFRWVSKKEVYRWPIFGWVLWMHGDIAIERGTGGAVRKMAREGKMWLDRGVSVMVFPEGSRSKIARVGRFHEGAFMMAKAAGVGVLPCVAEGTGTAIKGWKLNFRNKFAVRVLPPVEADEVARTDTKELTQKMQQLVSVQYDKLKAETGNRYD